MNIGVLTSSRADYGIYVPLLKILRRDKYFNFCLLVFGTHLSEKFGNTVKQIETDEFKIGCRIETLSNGDSPGDISESMAKTISSFKNIWISNQFDLIIALGDRYEMFAAVASSVPFNLPIAHIHGGETTSGAIDNVFRHSITSMAKYHFTSTKVYADRVAEIIGSYKHVYNVGALSIDNLTTLSYLTIEEFKAAYKVDLQRPTILITFHPETIEFERNKLYAQELVSALAELTHYQQIITMPNSDTEAFTIREILTDYAADKENVYCFESLGSDAYLSCMKYSTIMLGNSSSGFVEAAFFSKPVINIGGRQRGRTITPNIINAQIIKSDILKAVSRAEELKNPGNCNIYGDGRSAEKIIQILKSI